MSIASPIRCEDVAEFCKELHSRKKKIVFTNGCFDILHVGHVTYLTQARALGDFLFVGLNSDQSVRKLKGDTRPVQSELDRCLILNSLKCVDAVSIFSEETPLELIKLIRPEILVKGGDWRPSQIVGSDRWQSFKLALCEWAFNNFNIRKN
jgi:rfaE bifunctional protein nucleotidyltransferase chain/domain